MKKPVQYESCKSLWDNKLFFKEILVNNCILSVSCGSYILYLWSLICACVNYFKNMQCNLLVSIKGINNLQCALDLRCYTVWLSIYFILVAVLIHISDALQCDFCSFFRTKSESNCSQFYTFISLIRGRDIINQELHNYNVSLLLLTLLILVLKHSYCNILKKRFDLGPVVGICLYVSILTLSSNLLHCRTNVAVQRDRICTLRRDL